MESFFQRIGTIVVATWGIAIIALLAYILKYLDGIARFLIYLSGM